MKFFELNANFEFVLRNFLRAVVFIGFVYFSSYFLVIKKWPGVIRADGTVHAEPVVRFMQDPDNTKSNWLWFYRPVILCHKKLRPKDWLWEGDIRYE